MNHYLKEYLEEKQKNIHAMASDPKTKVVKKAFMDQVGKYKYGYYSCWGVEDAQLYNFHKI